MRFSIVIYYLKSHVSSFILLLVNALFLIGCTTGQNENTEPPQPNNDPLSIALNTDEGYTYNQFNGDSIPRLINGYGEEIITGKPQEITGISVHPDSILYTEKIRVPQPIISTAEDLYQDTKFTKYSAPKKLENFILEEVLIFVTRSQRNFILNSIGDSISTGVPLAIAGTTVPVTFKPSITASSWQSKEDLFYNIQFLDVDQGLPSSYILCTLQDHLGNIWIGTSGGGISKYNGHAFYNYTTEDGLSDNVILCMYQDQNQNLWFGTYSGGIIKFDGQFFTTFTEADGLGTNNITSITEDASGNIWFGTTGGGIIKYGPEIGTNKLTFTHYTTHEGLNSNYINDILFENEQLWIGTADKGLNIMKDEIVYRTKDNSILNGVFINDLGISKDQSVYIATMNNGFFRICGQKILQSNMTNGLMSEGVKEIFEDKDGSLWLAHSKRGISKIEGETITYFSTQEGLTNNIVNSFMQDNAGNIWVGTSGGGINILNLDPFTHYSTSEGLGNPAIFSITEDKHGDLWFGSLISGASKLNQNNVEVPYFVNYGLEEGLGFPIWKILKDSKGNLWFGTYGSGVVQFDGQDFIYFNNQTGLAADDIRSIYEDRNQNIWFGSFGGGITRFDGQNFVHFTEEQGLSSNEILSITQDKVGNMWFGTSGGGAIKLEVEQDELSGTVTYFTEKEGLSSNIVMSMLTDEKGDLWLGTSGAGLNHFNGEQFTYYSTQSGLSNNTIWSLSQDTKSRIWASTEKGISCLIASDSIDYKKSITFDKRDGLKGMDFFLNSVLIDEGNHIWWGSGKSLTTLDLNQLQLATKPPTLNLDQLAINEAFVNTDDDRNLEYDSISGFSNFPINLQLPHHLNHLTFYFSAIDWYAPHKIKYSYRLEGINEDWSQPSIETKAEYRNLSHGNYTFMVRAIGESGTWSEPATYAFTILPPWWLTWWAWTIYVLVFLIIIQLIFKLRTRRLKQRQIELENEVALATEEIRSQKELIEEAHEEITSSINYAERIQRSFLASDEFLSENLKEYFVYFNPKEAVSGDFYWAGKLSNGDFAISCADSTGHGVPGAIMSILNISSIEKSVDNGSTLPAEIFNETRKLIIERLKKDGTQEGGKDGMDASLISFDREHKRMNYVAAQNPIWIVRKNELIEIKGEKMPVGKHDLDHEPFKGGSIELENGDMIFLLTDGFQDQFGGELGKKFKAKPLKNLLIEIASKPATEQEKIIDQTFVSWKQNLEQIDDVCLIGIKIQH